MVAIGIASPAKVTIANNVPNEYWNQRRLCVGAGGMDIY
jgi:hypothetical protein